MTKNPVSRFIRTSIVMTIFGMLFVYWQAQQNPEGFYFHCIVGLFLIIIGLVISGVLSILEAIENATKQNDEDAPEEKKILKG